MQRMSNYGKPKRSMSSRKPAGRRVASGSATGSRMTRELPPGGRKPGMSRPAPRNTPNTAGRATPKPGQPSRRRGPSGALSQRPAPGKGRTRPMPARRPMPGRKPGMR